jgi:hypothetical protein
VRLLAVTIVSLTVVSVATAAQGDPKKVIIPSVQAKAKAVNVHVSDLGPGSWTPKGSSPGQTTPRCSYYNPDQSDLTENASADSPQFTLPTQSFVSSSTAIFKTAAQGRTAYSRVIKPALPRCLGELFRKASGAGSKIAIISAKATRFPNLAERTNAYRVSAKYKVSATVSLPVYLDFVAMNRAKVDVVIFFAGIGQPFSSSYEQGVARKVAARMATVR